MKQVGRRSSTNGLDNRWRVDQRFLEKEIDRLFALGCTGLDGLQDLDSFRVVIHALDPFEFESHIAAMHNAADINGSSSRLVCLPQGFAKSCFRVVLLVFITWVCFDRVCVALQTKKPYLSTISGARWCGFWRRTASRFLPTLRTVSSYGSKCTRMGLFTALTESLKLAQAHGCGIWRVTLAMELSLARRIYPSLKIQTNDKKSMSNGNSNQRIALRSLGRSQKT